MLYDDSDYMRRATNAYFKSHGTQAQQPSVDSGVQMLAGRSYAVLHNQGGILAVYGITQKGSLKRLRRWPAALE